MHALNRFDIHAQTRGETRMATRTRCAAATALALLMATVATAATTPAQKCQSDKNKEAGKYAACRQKAEGDFAVKGDATRLASALERCLARYQIRWSALETRAAGACPTDGDMNPMAAFIDYHTDTVATALAGNPVPNCPADRATCEADLGTCTTDLAACTPDLATCTTDLDATQAGLAGCTSDLNTCTTDLDTCGDDVVTCNAALEACEAGVVGRPIKTGQLICTNAAGATIPCAGTGQDGELRKGLARSYVDNGNGTITDQTTGLMWEKLSNDGTIHDRDNGYTWANAFAVKVAGLNTSAFAGHTDWRVPNVLEIQSLVDYESASPSISAAFNTACPTGCTVLTCSCIDPFAIYWSSTTGSFSASSAWYQSFDLTFRNTQPKTATARVRAVRDAS